MFEFRKVRCSSYLKKVNDGRCLECDGKYGFIEEVRYIGEGDDVPDKCECIGALEFLKTYYKRVDAQFEGLFVGTKTVVVDAYLWGDIDYQPNGSERICIGRHINTRIECGVVYYANNRKRYVPLVDIETL